MKNTCKNNSPKRTHVGIAEMAVTKDPTEILIAANLGSCLGISAFDPEMGIAGMIHCLLPLSKSDPEKAKANPCMYVDTGVVRLLQMLVDDGAKKENLQLVVVGGANINDEGNVFEIGKKNFTVFRKVLWKNNLLIAAQDVGEKTSRTLTLCVNSGDVYLKKNGDETQIYSGGN